MRFTIWFVVGSPRAHGGLTLSDWEEELTRSNATAMTPPQTKTTCLHVCMRSNTQKKRHTCVAAEPVCVTVRCILQPPPANVPEKPRL